MTAIKCTNCGAILKPKDPIPPGKKVKCPKCAQPFIVQAEEAAEPEEPVKVTKPADDEAEDAGGVDEDSPPPKRKSGVKIKGGESDDGDDDDDDRGKGKKKSKGGEAPKKSNTLLIVGIVVGVLLLCCCLPTCGSVIVNWSEISKALDDGAKKAQQKK